MTSLDASAGGGMMGGDEGCRSCWRFDQWPVKHALRQGRRWTVFECGLQGWWSTSMRRAASTYLEVRAVPREAAR